MRKTGITIVVAMLLCGIVVTVAVYSNKSDNSDVIETSPLPTASGAPASEFVPESNKQTQDIATPEQTTETNV